MHYEFFSRPSRLPVHNHPRTQCCMICVADTVKWTKETEFLNLTSKARHRTKQSVNLFVVRNITTTGAGSLAVRRVALGGEAVGSTVVIDL
jgi:hypothetical protein